ncbi:MAG TPA: hydrogenase formation protein HypD [Thermoplasmatales archaeon]|nr:hydrogenase formation protein HypD [Thermoplasmatales archaeon]
MLQLRDKKIADKILSKIKNFDLKIKIMHVCGTHQDTIVRYGIDKLLKECGVEVIQGPGCPVCVTTQLEIQKAITLAKNGVRIATFGDMVRVPAGETSLEKIRAEGGDVKIVYSIDDALNMAKEKEVVFLGVGFETTAPSTAVTLLNKPNNFYVLSYHRFIPPAMDTLLGMGEIKIDGIICPGHVSTIIGILPYIPISEKYKIPQVIAGFEPLDVLMAVYMIARQINEGRHEVENEYIRCVAREGNLKAQEAMKKVFCPSDVKWRGFPKIKKSGMALRKKFEENDAEKIYEDLLNEIEEIPEPKGCRCGDVLRGIIYPQDCPLFGKICTPSKPVGPCMVSVEGACNIEYRYKND